MKTISDRIFELLKEKGMSQKEFSARTGIAESSISDWKKKRTNPVSDKILIICEVLEVTPLICCRVLNIQETEVVLMIHM